MARTKAVTVYQFDELSDRAKERAREWYRSCGGPEDFEFVIEDAETILGMLGFELKYHTVPLHGGGTRQDPNIWWQVGYCQSDGAAFDARYSYAKGAHRNIRKHAPEDTELHRIALELMTLQRRYRYAIVADVSNRQHFWQEIEVLDGCTNPEDTKALGELVRDLGRWIYHQLRTEDEYRSADAQVDENIRANEYEFDEHGHIDR